MRTVCFDLKLIEFILLGKIISCCIVSSDVINLEIVVGFMIEHWLLGWWNWLATEVIGFIYLLVINIALTGSAMFPEVCEKFGVRRGKGGGVNT